MSRYVAVVLAAGQGRRMGGIAKALLRTGDGRGFLEAIAACARDAGVDEILVVAGGDHLEATRAEAARLGLPVAINPAPERGMASSVAVGFGAAAGRWPEAEVGLLWPVDHPYVAAATVTRLLSRARVDGIVVPVAGGRGGHPTVFGRRLWPELAACTEAPTGARSVLERHAEATERVPVSDPDVTADVDTRADLR